MKQTVILICFLILVVCSHSVSASVIIDYGNGDNDFGMNWVFLNPSTVAYDFAVGSSDLLLTHMGIYDSSLEGLSYDHDTVVWDSTGMIIVSAVVLQGNEAQLFDGFRFNSVDSPVTLHAGQTYVVGARYTSGDDVAYSPGTWDPTANPHFSSVGANHAIFESDSLEFPGSFNGTDPVWGPSFQYSVVPEPSTYALFLCGIAIILFSKRKYMQIATRK